jgi:transcriptional regulator with XRE-family HTH domain
MTYKDLNNIISKKLRKRRKFMSITQLELSNKIGISAAQLYKYENGLNKISANLLYSISKVLNTPIWYFFDLENDVVDFENENTHLNLREDVPKSLFGNNDLDNNLYKFTDEELQLIKKEYDEITDIVFKKYITDTLRSLFNLICNANK